MKKWLGLSEEEFAENERLYAEENPEKLIGKNITMPKVNPNQIPGLQSIGIDEADVEQLKALQDVFANEQASSEPGVGLGGAGSLGAGFGGGLGGGMDIGADLGAETGSSGESLSGEAAPAE